MTFQSFVNLACNYYPLLKPHVEASGGDDLALVERLNLLGPPEYGFNLYQSYLSADASTKVSFDVWSLEEIRKVLLQYKSTVSQPYESTFRDEYWAMYDIKVPDYQFPKELFATLSNERIGMNALNYQRALLDNLLEEVRDMDWVQQLGTVEHDTWLVVRPELSRMLQQLVVTLSDSLELPNLQNAFTVMEENPDVYNVTLTSVAQGMVDLGMRVEAWKQDVVIKLSSFEFWQKAFPFLFGGGRATANTAPYFDSTPSETIMPEDKSYTPIPDEKLRRTNPKRYDARHDQYSENNQFGDTPVSNRYDNPPPTVSSLKFAFDVDTDFEEGDRVRIHHNSKRLGTVVGWSVSNVHKHYDVRGDDGKMYSLYASEMTRDFGKRLAFETQKYNIGQKVWVIHTGFWHGNMPTHYMITIAHIYLASSVEQRHALERMQQFITRHEDTDHNNMPDLTNVTLYESTTGSTHWETELEPLRKDKHYYASLEEIDWEINRTVEACQHLQKNSSIFDNEYYAAWSQDFIEKLLVRHELAQEVAV